MRAEVKGPGKDKVNLVGGETKSGLFGVRQEGVEIKLGKKQRGQKILRRKEVSGH